MKTKIGKYRLLTIASGDGSKGEVRERQKRGVCMATYFQNLRIARHFFGNE